MRRQFWRAGLGAGFALACSGFAPTARAQSWVSDVQLSLATGIEGADTGQGVAWQRARTRLIVGLDLGNSETGSEAYGVRSFVELERSLSVGAELGYVRWVLPQLSLFFGGVAVFTPRTLFGGTAAANYVFPLGKRLGLAVLTSFSVLPLGSDRPDNGAVVWGLLGVGIRGRL
ncbi:MAG: hypothetical protein ABI895_20380 [Deltaproteobacteria bacterium]